VSSVLKSEANLKESLSPVEAAAHLAQRQAGLIEGELTVLEEAGETISCRSGCAACCRQLVVVSPMEALVIDQYVRSADAKQQKRWMEAHSRHRAAMARRPSLLSRLRRFQAAGGYIPPEEGDALEREHWAAQIPCPFLEDERCTIYPARPFACREHYALTPAELCAQDLDAVRTLPSRFEFRAIAGRVGDQCFNLDDHLIPLFHALDHAADHRPAHKRAAPLTAITRLMEITLSRVMAWRRMLR
jgi:Fe-S-cluster containining protein